MPQPARISRYEIKCPIGGGGMGTLYLARDTNPTTDRLVALKLLKANLDGDDLRARFAREAQSLARLNHPNIVSIHDSGDFDGAPFIVMEYVRGETLAEKLKRHAPVPLRQKLTWLIELCSGLAHAHDAGVIHRDVKPANLIVDLQGRLRIVDFGIARVSDALTRMGVGLTQMGLQVGTPGYMAPEQIEGDEVDHRSDLFGVGAVAYELLAGREAFPGSTTREIERLVLASDPPALDTLVPEVGTGLSAVVAKALAKDPNRRYQDAAALEAALEGERAQLRSSDTPVPGRSTPPPGGSKGRGSRADVAYQHATALLNDGAREAAKRFMLEALAEDSGHPGARALLGQIKEGRGPVEPPAKVSVPPRSADATAVALPAFGGAPSSEGHGDHHAAEDRTIVLRPAPPVGDDLVAGAGRRPSLRFPRSSSPAVDATVLASPRRAPVDTTTHRPRRPGAFGAEGLATPEPFDSGASPFDATIVGGPPVRPAPSQPVPPPTPVKARGRRAGSPPMQERQRPRRPAIDIPWDPREWSRRTQAVVAGLAAGVLMIGIVLSVWRPWDAGIPLTVQASEGGTIVGEGVRCGAEGTACVVAFGDGEVVRLEAQPAEGYIFTGFSGDCAPSGMVVMDAPRDCAASFARSEPEAVSATTEFLLTIVAGPGGSVVGGGVDCGTRGKACIVKQPAQTIVELQGLADNGYVFQSFTGTGCTDGRVVMDSPRTCGATFARVGGPTSAENPGPLVSGGSPKPNPKVPPRDVPTGERPAAPGTTPTGGGGGGAGAAIAGAGGSAPPGASDPSPVATDKPVPPPITREEASRKLIAEALDKYSAAYRRLSYEELRAVFPTAPDGLRQQLRLYKSMEYALSAPKILVLDADAGTARVEVEYKQVYEARVGKPEPHEGKLTFDMFRGRNDDWLIRNATFAPKK